MEQHRRRRHAVDVCVFSFDYLFTNEAGERVDEVSDERNLIKVFVAAESKSGCVFARVVPQKGVDPDGYALDLLVEDIRWLGYVRILLKSDNEPAILNLLITTLIEMR